MPRGKTHPSYFYPPHIWPAGGCGGRCDFWWRCWKKCLCCGWWNCSEMNQLLQICLNDLCLSVCVCARVCVLGQICMRKATKRFSSGKGIKEEMEKTRHQHKIKLESFLWDGCLFLKKRGLNKNSLMYPRSTEGRGEALVLLQVGQGVVVELHGLARKPPAEFIDAFLHPVKWSLC